jgi:hypothetical protein
MAVADDLRSLATEDVVYLTKQIGFPYGAAQPQLEVFKGRLRQTAQGEWVFTSFTGQSGVVGLILGPAQGDWSSSQPPGQGIEVLIPVVAVHFPPLASDDGTVTINVPPIRQWITLTTVIPSDFAE